MSLFKKRKKQDEIQKLYDYKRKSNGRIWAASTLLAKYKIQTKALVDQICTTYKVSTKGSLDANRRTAFILAITYKYSSDSLFYSLITDLMWNASSGNDEMVNSAIYTDYMDSLFEHCISCLEDERFVDAAGEVQIATAFLSFFELEYDKNKIDKLLDEVEKLYDIILDANIETDQIFD